jgi:flagellar motor switch protein FliN/FliY
MEMNTVEIEKPVRAQALDYPELGAGDGAGQRVLGNNPALLDSVKVRLSVVVGHADTTLGELMALKEAAVLKIDRHVEQPVDLVINGEVVARGQLVAVDDNFGVRITEVVSIQA